MRTRLCLLAALALCAAAATIAAADDTAVPASGENPDPVKLVRREAKPLSAMAQLGKLLFYDTSLSFSGGLSCASCHSPDHAYGPATDKPVVLGGPDLKKEGARAVPSLMYLERQPSFSIGPDNEENENVDLAQAAALGESAVRAQKVATDTAAAGANLVPQGGLFWDGRADTLQQQALFPLLNPLEMAASSIDEVAAKLKNEPYAYRFTQLFGLAVFDDHQMAVTEALFAIGRYQIEEPSFHPYTSKFDYWLEGRARLSEQEMRGYTLFNDPKKANCGGCHLDKPTADGLPPLFTDHQYEALGVPRNAALAANADPAYFDLGICGPYRTDISDQTQYCAMFATPTLRNAATRQVFMHNGVYHTLEQVMDFYNFRDVAPEKIYPSTPDGVVLKYDDIPEKYRANVDVDPPFDRHLGDPPAMTQEDEADIIAFLKTLTDGYQPAK